MTTVHRPVVHTNNKNIRVCPLLQQGTLNGIAEDNIILPCAVRFDEHLKITHINQVNYSKRITIMVRNTSITCGE